MFVYNSVCVYNIYNFILVFLSYLSKVLCFYFIFVNLILCNCFSWCFFAPTFCSFFIIITKHTQKLAAEKPYITSKIKKTTPINKNKSPTSLMIMHINGVEPKITTFWLHIIHNITGSEFFYYTYIHSLVYCEWL